MNTRNRRRNLNARIVSATAPVSGDGHPPKSGEPKGMALQWARKEGPSHGPYADAWFDEADGIHRVRLTAEGRAKAEEYLSLYPHPIGLLISTWPNAYRAARSARFSDEEIHSLCLEGVALAVARFNPNRGAAIATAIVWGVRAAVTQAVRKAHVNSSRAYAHLKTIRITHRVAERSPNKVDGYSDDSWEKLTCCLTTSHLTKKERRVLILCYGLDGEAAMTRTATSRRLGVSRERVRQLQESAIRKIRSTLGLDLDWESAARARIVGALSSLHARSADPIKTSSVQVHPGVTKSELSRRTGVAKWELRVVLPLLLEEGQVIRERCTLSRGRYSILFRMNPDGS